MRRRIVQICAIAITLFSVTFLAVILQTSLVKHRPYNALAPVDVIVCLGAGMDTDGTLHHAAKLRVETCAALYAAGNAPVVHFTGGSAVEGGPSAGGRMAQLATQLGVPRAAITVEDASQSTLQNALFSKPMLEGADSLRIVTEGFHLPRSYASFAVMGDYTIHLTMSEPVRLTAKGRWNWRVLLRETVAIWFNLGRYAVWVVMGFAGSEGRDAILA